MNFKYYLRGLGTGIFVTTMVLSIAFEVRISKMQSFTQKNPETQSESTAEAASSEEISHKETESFSKSSDEETQNETETSTEDLTTEQDASTNETDISTSAPQSATVTIDIYSGMSSNKVAARLEELGVVEDADDFNNYMYKRHIENSIRIGRFEISQDASYDEIIAAITGRR